MLSNWIGKAVVLAIAITLSVGIDAAPPTFKIDSVFSNLDGSVQFIRLTETAGLDGQNRFKGLKLTSTHNGLTREYTFANDIPTEFTAHVTLAVVASSGVLATESAGVRFCCWQPYFGGLSERFLGTAGGTIDFAGVDRLTYGALPTDGVQALSRDGSPVPALLPTGKCMSFPCSNGVQIAVTSIRAVEYYNDALDHYFATALATEIDALDAGIMPGWKRTGLAFPAFGGSKPASPAQGPVAPIALLPVCRFYIPPQFGDSHFLSASREECAEVAARFPQFVMESEAAFYVGQPNLATGACPQAGYDPQENEYGWTPVFRLWNRRPDTNHRYTREPLARDAMIAQGWVLEGYGPTGVAFCGPLFP